MQSKTLLISSIFTLSKLKHICLLLSIMLLTAVDAASQTNPSYPQGYSQCDYRILELEPNTTNTWAYARICRTTNEETTYWCPMVEGSEFWGAKVGWSWSLLSLGPLVWKLYAEENNKHKWKLTGATAYFDYWTNAWVQIDPNQTHDIEFDMNQYAFNNATARKFSKLQVRWGSRKKGSIKLEADVRSAFLGQCLANCSGNLIHSTANDFFIDEKEVNVSSQFNPISASIVTSGLSGSGTQFFVDCISSGSFGVNLVDDLGNQAKIDNISWTTNNPNWSISNSNSRNATVHFNGYSAVSATYTITCTYNIECRTPKAQSNTITISPDIASMPAPVSLAMPMFNNVINVDLANSTAYNFNSFGPVLVHTVGNGNTSIDDAYLGTEFQIQRNGASPSIVKFKDATNTVANGLQSIERLLGNVELDPNGSAPGTSILIRARNKYICGFSAYSPWRTVYVNSCPVANLTVSSTELCNPQVISASATIAQPAGNYNCALNENNDQVYEWVVEPNSAEPSGSGPKLIHPTTNARVLSLTSIASSLSIDALQATKDFKVKVRALHPRAGTSVLTPTEWKEVNVDFVSWPVLPLSPVSVTALTTQLPTCTDYEQQIRINMNFANQNQYQFNWSDPKLYIQSGSSYVRYFPNPVMESVNSNSSNMIFKVADVGTAAGVSVNYLDVKRLEVRLFLSKIGSDCNPRSYNLEFNDPGNSQSLTPRHNMNQWWMLFEERSDCQMLSPLSVANAHQEGILKLSYPNPQEVGKNISFEADDITSCKAINTAGIVSNIEVSNTTLKTNNLLPGIYHLLIYHKNGKVSQVRQVIN